MSYQLSQTPTLEAVASGDEALLARDLQARVDEAVKQAESAPEVAAALESQAAAAARLARLRTAERELNQQSKQTRERAGALGQAVLDALVEAAGAGESGPVEAEKLGQLAAVEDQVRFMGRAIERLAEHQIPLAEIGGMQEEAHALLAQSRALERIAQERAEKVLGQIRAAVSEEMVLPVDLSKGVAGALLARAAALKSRAVRISKQADELGRAYQERYEA
jgi:hypothetical protein